LQIRAFKAVLAHEYGHFLDHSIVCDGLARIVERSIGKTMRGLRLTRTDRWWNPAWICLGCVRWIFQQVKRGASRICELRADRIAAATYGAQWVNAALRQTTAMAVLFEEHLHSAASAYLRLHRPLVNLYRAIPETTLDRQTMDERIRERLAHPGRREDEHPCLSERLRFDRAVEGIGPDSTRDAAPAWSLFADREQCQRNVTTDFRAALDARLGALDVLSAPSRDDMV